MMNLTLSSNKVKIAIGFVALLILFGGVYFFNQNSRQRDNSTVIPPYEEVEVLLSDNTNESGLIIFCPFGVTCDENYHHRAFTYRDDRYYLYMSFEPNIVNNYSLNNFKKYYTGDNHINIQFPELGSRSTYVEYQPRDNQEIVFTDYKEGRLKGEIRVPVEKVNVISKNRECHYADDPSPPSYCRKTLPYNKLIRIKFDFTVPEEVTSECESAGGVEGIDC